MENESSDSESLSTEASTSLTVNFISAISKSFSRTKWMSRNSIEVLVLCSLLIFIATTVPNIQWPFAILYFQKLKASTISISIYVSCMSVFLLVTSIFSQKIKLLMPMKHMLIVCVFVLCGASCLHGMLVYIDGPNLMVAFGILIRAVQGITATMIQVLAVAVLIVRFPNKTGRVSAVNESALGLGFSLAPFIGGLVYDKVGYLQTFVIIGGCGFLMIGPLCITSSEKLEHSEGDKEYSKIKWWDFLFISPLITCLLSTICETCVDYVMAIYVNDKFGEDATFSGLMLSCLSLSSLLFAFVLGYFCDTFNPFILGITGSLLSSLGFLGMVPPPYIGVQTSKVGLTIASVVTGLGQAMIWLHVMPSMLFVKIKCREKMIDQKLSNMVSLLYIVATSTGEIIGSFLAGALLEYCMYWQYFAVLSTLMMSTLIFGVYLYYRSKQSLTRSLDSLDSTSNDTADIGAQLEINSVEIPLPGTIEHKDKDTYS